MPVSLYGDGFLAPVVGVKPKHEMRHNYCVCHALDSVSVTAVAPEKFPPFPKLIRAMVGNIWVGGRVFN